LILILAVRRDEIFSVVVKNGVDTLIWCVVALLLAIIIAVPMTLYLTRPLVRLGHEMRDHISRLEFGTGDPPLSYLREVRSLQTSFQVMTRGM
jgi:hypothetical protein